MLENLVSECCAEWLRVESKKNTLFIYFFSLTLLEVNSQEHKAMPRKYSEHLFMLDSQPEIAQQVVDAQGMKILQCTLPG